MRNSSRILLVLLSWAGSAHATMDLLVSSTSTQSIRRYDGATGVFKGHFVAEGAGGLVAPRSLTVGPDGNLYVADSVSNRVKRFSMADGSFIDNFTPDDLASPVTLRFGADGDLYLMGNSTTQRQIRRYNGNTGNYISTPVTGTPSNFGAPFDFIRLLGGQDFLVIGGFTRGSRFAASNGAFIGAFINPTGSSSILQSPRAIIVGTENNYWVANRGLNRITRFDASTGEKINDIATGSWLDGPSGLLIHGDGLYVANAISREIVRYEISNPTTASLSSPTVFVPASQGLTAPEHMTMAFVNDPPVAEAGAHVSIPGGEAFTLDGGGSSDPDGQTLGFSWTQVSGIPLLSNPPVTTVSLSLTAPFQTGSATFQLLVADTAGLTVADSVTVTITAPLDADDNGLPDRWEETQPTLTGGADADDDQDGTSNRFEYLAGTDATDPESVFKLIDQDLGPAAVTLRFRSGTGRNYQFQRSPDLVTWSAVAGYESVPGTGGLIELSVPPVIPGFYRIAAKPDF